MADNFLVVTEDLRSDIETWADWSERVGGICGSVVRLGWRRLDGGEERALNESDFSTISGAQELVAAYKLVTESFNDALVSGQMTLNRISGKLRTVSERYEGAEDQNLETLSAIEI